MIIVDDCSPDDGQGKDIVNRIKATDSRIKLVSLPENKGSSGARNKGIENASGEYIAFLDADDLWDSFFLEKQLQFMTEKDASIIFSSYKRISEDGQEEVFPPFIVPEKVNYRKILRSLPIFPSTAVINAGKIGKNFFNEGMGSLRDDYVYWLNLLKNHVDFAYGNQEVLASYRLRKDSVTSNKLKVIQPHWYV
jgi:glycosyltransferase involved in cell wall biosynthesis